MNDGVLIVVPCLNEAAHLDDLLGALRAEMRHDDIVVVADGGSRDGSQDIVARHANDDPRIILLDNPHRLQSGGINLAVAVHGGERRFMVRIDAHAGYPKDFVRRLTATADQTKADSVVVPMRTVGRRCFQVAAATAQNAPIGAGGSAHRIGGDSGWIDHGHHALMRLDAFRRIGGYDPRFSHNEDAEYDRRLVATGGRIWFQGDLAIDYFPRGTPWALLRQYINHGRGRARTVVKHRMPLKLRQMAPALVGPAVVAAVVAGFAGILLHPLAWILATPAMIWLAACLIGGVLAASGAKAPLCGYAAGLAAMMMHLGWSWGFLSGRFLGANRDVDALASPPAR